MRNEINTQCLQIPDGSERHGNSHIAVRRLQDHSFDHRKYRLGPWRSTAQM